MYYGIQADGIRMNRRSRLRFKTDITVTITLLEQPGGTAKGRLKNLSAHGLSVILGEQLAPDSFVKVEWGNKGFNGRLIYCKQEGKEFLTGFEVSDHVYDARQKTAQEELDSVLKDF